MAYLYNIFIACGHFILLSCHAYRTDRLKYDLIKESLPHSLSLLYLMFFNFTMMSRVEFICILLNICHLNLMDNVNLGPTLVQNRLGVPNYHW